jgi:hypothetical protein
VAIEFDTDTYRAVRIVAGLHWLADSRRRCQGNKVDLIQAFVKIQGLATLRISGYYGKHWPAYLEKQMSLDVGAICGREGVVEDDDEPELFRAYQRATKDLYP